MLVGGIVLVLETVFRCLGERWSISEVGPAHPYGSENGQEDEHEASLEKSDQARLLLHLEDLECWPIAF